MAQYKPSGERDYDALAAKLYGELHGLWEGEGSNPLDDVAYKQKAIGHLAEALKGLAEASQTRWSMESEVVNSLRLPFDNRKPKGNGNGEVPRQVHQYGGKP